MAVVIETTLGDITVDLYLDQRPVTCLNFLKLCKMKYYNFNLFHTIRSGFIAQTGDPTGEGSGGESIFGLLEGPEKRFFSGETMPKIRHTDTGLLSMVGTGEMMVGSQFFFTLGTDLDSLDGVHCVIGEVTEGHEVLRKLNEVICDESHRPYQDVRITHTVILEDPFNDPKGHRAPSRSPSPTAERLKGGRIAPDEEIDEVLGRSAAEVQEMIEEKEAKARATILEIIGDIPDADIAPPENVLFVCKLNPVTTDEDLEIIFSRFGNIVSCEVIRDKKSGDSLQYAFIEFADKKSCEDAYFKMDNVLIDDRRIHVDFSQSVSKIKWLGKGRGVQHIGDENKNNKHIQEYTSKPSNNRYKDRNDAKYYRERNSDTNDKKHEYENRDREKYNDQRHRDRHSSSRNRSKRERSRSRSKLETRDKNAKHGNNNTQYDRNKKNCHSEKKYADRGRNRDRSPKSKVSPVRDERSNARDKNRIRSPKSKPSPEGDEISDSKMNRFRSPQSKQSPVRREMSASREKKHFRSPKSKASPIKDESSNNRDRNRLTSSKSKASSSVEEKSSDKERNHPEEPNSSQPVQEKKKRDKSEPSQKTLQKVGRASKHDNSNEKYINKKHKNHQDQSDKRKKDNVDADSERKSKSKRNRAEPQTPPKEEKQNKDKTKKVKVEKDVNKNRKIKKRKPSTSSDSDSSESSSSSSSESSSSSNSDSRKKNLKRKKRKHSTSSSSSSTESSSSSSSSDSSSDSTSSSSDSEPSKRKSTKNNKKGGKKPRKK